MPSSVLSAVPRRRIPWYRKLTYAAVVLVGVAAISEAALRVIDPQILAFVYQARQFHRYTTWHKVDLRPDQRASLFLSRADGSDYLRFTVTTNDLSIRNLGAVGDSANPGDRTVVHCLGDSFTMGWGVDDDQSYPAQLARVLGPAHRVLNLGVPGYGLLAAAEKSRRLAAAYLPDIILYLFCRNDFEDDEVTRTVQRRHALQHAGLLLVDSARHHSYLANIPWALQTGFALREPRGRGPAVVTPASTRSEESVREEMLRKARMLAPRDHPTTTGLVEFAEECRRSKTRLVVLVIDESEAALQVVKLCQNQGLEIVVAPMLDAGFTIADDGHLNAEGNRRLAERVARVLSGK